MAPVPFDRLDSEGIHPSIYRGVTKIKTPPPGYKKYVLYNSEGGYMGEVMLADKYATAESERLILALQAMNDPEEDEPPISHLKLA